MTLVLVTAVIRFDRGTLQRPLRRDGALVVEGYAARVHTPSDPLRYPHGNEYRDRAELEKLVAQLPGLPVTLPHPPGLLKYGAKGRVIGRIDSAWLDGDAAAVRMTITDAVSEIESGVKELSLGYETDLDAANYQRDSRADHLAVVAAARCGKTCSLRTDASTDEESHCACGCALQIDRPAGCGEIGHTERETMADEKTDKQRADELETTVATLNTRIKTLEGDLAAGAQTAETEALRKEKLRADAADENVRKLEAKFADSVRARVSLVTQATAVLGTTVRLDDMSDRQVHEAVIKRLDASVNVASENDDQVRGRFNTLLSLNARNVESQARVAEILGRGNPTEAARADSESYEDSERNRWKSTLKNGRNSAAEGR